MLKKPMPKKPMPMKGKCPKCGMAPCKCGMKKGGK